jgi:hypothetical protein
MPDGAVLRMYARLPVPFVVSSAGSPLRQVLDGDGSACGQGQLRARLQGAAERSASCSQGDLVVCWGLHMLVGPVKSCLCYFACTFAFS